MSPLNRQVASFWLGSPRPARPSRPGLVEVYRDPSCGCCEARIYYLKARGFTPAVHQEPAMSAVKARA